MACFLVIPDTESACDDYRIWSSQPLVSAGPTSTDAEGRLRVPKSSADFAVLGGRGLGTNPLQIPRTD